MEINNYSKHNHKRSLSRDSNKNNCKTKNLSTSHDACRICNNDPNYNFSSLKNKYTTNANINIEYNLQKSNNYSNNFQDKTFLKKLENINEGFILQNNILIYPCQCDYPVHKLCLTKRTVFSQINSCKYCKFIYIFQSQNGEDLSFCVKLSKLNLLGSFLIQLIILIILAVAIYFINTQLLNVYINSVFYFWGYIIDSVLILVSIVIIINLITKTIRVRNIKAVKILDIAEVKSISSNYKKLVDLSAEVLYNFLLINFDIDYEDLSNFRNLRLYLNANLSLDSKITHFIKYDKLLDKDNSQSDCFSGSRSHRFSLPNNNNLNNNNINNLDRSFNSESKVSLVSLSRKSSDHPVFYVKEYKDYVMNIDHPFQKGNDIEDPIEDVNFIKLNKINNDSADLLVLKSRKNSKTANEIQSNLNSYNTGTSSILSNNNAINIKSKDEIYKSNSPSNKQVKENIAESNKNIQNVAKKIEISIPKPNKVQSTKTNINSYRRPSMTELIALKYQKGVMAIDEHNGDFNESSQNLSLASRSRKMTSQAFKFYVSPDRKVRSFKKGSEKFNDKFALTFDEQNSGILLPKPKTSYNSQENKMNNKLDEMLSKDCSDNLIIVDKKNSGKSLKKMTKDDYLIKAKTCDDNRSKIFNCFDIPKDKKEFNKYIDSKFFKEEDASFEETAKALSERDRVKLMIDREDIKYNSFLEDTSKSNNEEIDDNNNNNNNNLRENVNEILEKNVHNSMKDQLKVLLKENS